MTRFGRVGRIPIVAVTVVAIALAGGVGVEAKTKPHPPKTKSKSKKPKPKKPKPNPKKKGKSTRKSVTVGDNFFKPTSVTVSANTAVVWHWTGKAAHNVTVVGGPKQFQSPTQSDGSYTHKFTVKGTYSIVCTIHAPSMNMQVIVK